ncbi:MAG: IS110 family transposase [Myxococcales bacterium]|nr:IS110 family transposase [Myxococcales bacterium]
MDHIAIDLGSRESQICVRNESNEITEERRIGTDELSSWLQNRLPGRLVLETCSESFGLADTARQFGHEVRVVPSTLVRSLGVGARRIKTDRRDAQVLSAASVRIDLPSVHVPSVASRQVKSLCTSRETLVEARTKLICSVRGFFRTHRHKIPSGGSSTFASRAQHAGFTLPPHILAMLRTIDGLSAEITALDVSVAQMAKGDALCSRLMTVPGVGPVTALRFVAAVDDVQRFHDAHQLESYFGLVPGEHSSGNRKTRTSITKAGSVKVRWVMVQAAWSAWRCRPNDPMVQWAQRIAERRGRKVAILALARKIAGILFALCRNGKSYDPSRAADRIDADGVIHKAAT